MANITNKLPQRTIGSAPVSTPWNVRPDAGEFTEHKYINKGGYPDQDPHKFPQTGGLTGGNPLPVTKGPEVKSVKDR